MPPTLLGKVPSTRAIAHRLIYRYIPGAIEGNPRSPSKTLEFEIVREHVTTTPDVSLERSEPVEKSIELAGLLEEPHGPETVSSPTAVLSCSKQGEEIGTNLLLPDR